MSNQNNNSTMLKEFSNFSLDKNEVAFIYFGWAGILLKTDRKTIAFDIGKKSLSIKHLKMINNLDLILHSHSHWDHFDPETTMELYQNTQAPIVIEPQIKDEFLNQTKQEISHIIKKLTPADPNNPITVDEFTIDTIVGVHPRPISIFRILWDNFSVFHGADSGYVSLNKFSSNIAFIPTGSPSPSCSPENGLKMVLDLQPKIVIAMHGNSTQMEKFKKLVKEKLPNTDVIIPKLNKIEKFLI
ncbi:MAG: MBL fold metallo-hydrolase [Candidatus Hodarchaeales archaeon]|jgi:L-ascorbate metabolism protein UlaG (beta-lactamase superfamily)